ncbi:MAG TPA: Ku protein [Actinomycetota bacterium]|nr:Ku protein [Actinomycetota bacterium]
MARAIWTGSVTFGLVNIPVRLYSATKPRDVRFHQLEGGSGRRIRHKRVAEGSEEEVPYEEIVKGYEVDKGRYVPLTPDELEAVEPERGRSIEIRDFVDLAEIDPIYFEKTYYLGPQPDVGAEKPYALLHQAMEEQQKIGIAYFVMRTKEYLAAVRPYDDVLALATLYFADEVRGIEEMEHHVGEVKVDRRELEMAERLIESLAAEWEPDRYQDMYRQRVLELVERKARGEEIVVPEEAEPTKVVDLMDALRASVEATRGEPRPAGRTERRPGPKRGKREEQPASREDLYAEAQRLGVPGRSKMSKDELAAAVRRARRRAS